MVLQSYWCAGIRRNKRRHRIQSYTKSIVAVFLRVRLRYGVHPSGVITMHKNGIVILIFAAAAVALFYPFTSKGSLGSGFATTSALIPSGAPTTAYPLGVATSPAVNNTYVMNPSPVSALPRTPTATSLPSLASSLLGGASKTVAATGPYQQPPQVGSASYTYMTTPTAYANALENSNTAFTQATLDPTYLQSGGSLTAPVDVSLSNLQLTAPSGIPDITDASVGYVCDTCA